MSSHWPVVRKAAPIVVLLALSLTAALVARDAAAHGLVEQIRQANRS